MDVRTVNVVVALSARPMPIPELAGRLTEMGVRTPEGHLYQGRRGTYRLVSTIYDYLVGEGRHEEARTVAAAFTRPGGGYAYEL